MTTMRREELDAVLCGLVDPTASALVHEAALMAWGLDNNVSPYAIDVLVPPRSFDALAAAHGAQTGEHMGNRYVAFDGLAVPVRAWRSVGDDVRYEPRRLVFCEKFGRRCLRPEVVLEALPSSPDFRFLYEQRAALAEVLYFDDMTDEQLMEFRSYVRGV